MRLNINNYREILAEKQLSHEYIQKTTGLSKKTYEWILKNGFIEHETLERIADVIGCQVRDILRPDYEGYSGNTIEWIKDAPKATLSLSQRGMITKIKRLAEKRPDECQILAENKDGSICAHIPVSWIKINLPMNLSEEQRKKQAERMRRNCLNIK